MRILLKKYLILNKTNKTVNKNDGGLALGFDIGGSLCKICFFEGDKASRGQKQMANVVKSNIKYGSTGHRIDELSFRSDMLKGTFHFISFSTHRLVLLIYLSSLIIIYHLIYTKLLKNFF